MTKQGEVRDWLKDMELCEKYSDEIWSALPDGSLFIRKGNQLTTYWDSGRENAVKEYRQALPYWLQQYAAEKEHADTLLGANQMYQFELAESLGREAKLREAIEEALSWALNCGEYTVAEVIAILRGVLESLYSEEGEAK